MDRRHLLTLVLLTMVAFHIIEPGIESDVNHRTRRLIEARLFSDRILSSFHFLNELTIKIIMTEYLVAFWRGVTGKTARISDRMSSSTRGESRGFHSKNF